MTGLIQTSGSIFQKLMITRQTIRIRQFNSARFGLRLQKLLKITALSLRLRALMKFRTANGVGATTEVMTAFNMQ